MKKDSKMTYDSVLCGVCNHDNKIAVTVNEIPVCYECLKFIKNRAKQHGVDPLVQLEEDTKYVALNAT
ncbi:hypothetical protein [uncultured Draconibacterium sp.]|uniref:hypothetical protein n=1 Tax=uncultured Draconibacterium sp. TaxID=1573823 RepID=UPI00321748FE